MPLPAIVDCSAYRGDTWAQSFRFLENNVPVDITGMTFTAQARNRADEVYSLQVSTDAATATVTIGLVTSSIPAANYVYDLQADAGIEITTWVRGRLHVLRDVTLEIP